MSAFSALVLALLAVPSPSPRPPASAPAASVEERARWRARLAWPDECERGHALALRILELADGRVRVFPLEAGRSLVEVGCARGAYQDGLLFYLWDETRTPPTASALRVPTWEALDDEWEPAERVEAAGESAWDARQRTLTLVTRARGLGDCGTVARYRVQGSKLALLELRGRPCDGDPEKSPPPARWPRVFPK